MRTEWIVIAVLAVLALAAIAVFNRLVRQRNLVREGWSGIDVQLKRRSDLIPNLVETVKSYAPHERGVFEDVTARRAASAGIAALRRKRRHGQPRLHRRAAAARAAADRRTAAGAEAAAPGGDRTLSHFLRTTGPHLFCQGSGGTPSTGWR
ncbi:MAG TPA: LemA family protein [Xanthobacteraceae bacterium]|nr:LemA family protein [Xanthobacteraceae bacterium]